MRRRLLYRISSVIIPCVIFLWAFNPATTQDSETHNPIYEFQIETASAVAWSPDGEVLAIGDTSGIRLYTETLDFIDLLEQPTDEMKALAWSPDGQYLAAVGVQGGWRQSDVYVWNYETHEPVTIFDRHELLVPMLAWSPDSQLIASASWDKTVQTWDAVTGQIYHTFSIQDEHNSREVFSVTWSPVSNQIAAVFGLEMVVWNVDTGKAIQTFAGPKHPFPPNYHVIRWSPDGRYLASHFNVLDAATGEEIVTFETCPQSSVIDWHSDSQIIAILTWDYLFICDVPADQIVTKFDGGIGQPQEEMILGFLNAIDWHPDGKRLASVAFDGMVRIWQVF